LVHIGPKLARHEISEAGQSLTEVMVAITVLVVVLVPALLLVTRSTNVVYNNQFKVTAANLANGQLEADRASAVGRTLPPPASSPPQAIGTPTIGSETYSITQTAGWCVPPTASNGSWAPFTSTGSSYAYGVVVKVTWKEDSSGVQVAGVFTTPQGMFAPGAYPPFTTNCPL
jgi:type II secretory pathway pseudopilin PulG